MCILHKIKKLRRIVSYTRKKFKAIKECSKAGTNNFVCVATKHTHVKLKKLNDRKKYF
jgi:hypothetical protein